MKFGRGKREEREKRQNTPPANRLLTRLSSFSTRTLDLPSAESSPPPELPNISPSPSGEIYSGEEQSISTESSQTNMYRVLCQRMWRAWEELRCEYQGEKGVEKWNHAPTGLSHGDRQSKPSHSSSPIDKLNSINTLPTCSRNSVGRTSAITPVSSFSTRPLEMLSEGAKTVRSWIPDCGKFLPKASWSQTELSIMPPQNEGIGESAMGSTAKLDAPIPTAHTSTSASGVKKTLTDSQIAVKGENLETRGLKPKYLRYNRWDVEEEVTPEVADWSESANPLPRPPSMPADHPVMGTLREHPELFRIITSINVPLFRELLRDHPNPTFVKSIIDGLTEGFWPWADVDMPNYPLTNDQAHFEELDTEKSTFLHRQRDHEVSKGRFSEGFNGDLLPGMYCMPIFAIPKDEPGSYRLITHQSFGEHSLNSMTPHHERSFPMDGLARLGDQILRMNRELLEGEEIVLWKSDVAEAYRQLPMAPMWQVKQINTIDGTRYVDRCLAFGRRRSGDVYIAFMSLVLWIAERRKGIPNVNGFIDDTFAAQTSGSMIYHCKLNQPIPSDQAKMLELWDDLGIPYKLHKQLHGRKLMVLGIEIDTNQLTFTLPSDKKLELEKELDRFIFTKRQSAPRRPLRELQVLAGWMNWSFNIFPLLKPCLSNLYDKIRGLTNPKQRVTISRAMSDDLSWAKHHLVQSTGVHLLEARDWGPSSADLTVYTDACLTGLAFYIPSRHEGFWADIPNDIPSDWIFYREKWAVLAAIDHVITYLRLSKQRLLIYTDNTNTVDIYNTLHTRPLYNQLLQLAIDLLISSSCQLRVIHVPTTESGMADALSRRDFERAFSSDPEITLISFQPPRNTLGEHQK